MARRELVGNRRTMLVVVEHDGLISVRRCEQSAQQQVVQLVTTLEAGKLADQRGPEQVQIAERVENLVPYELVAETQAVLVDDAVVVHDDRVVEIRAERTLAGTSTFEVLQ